MLAAGSRDRAVLECFIKTLYLHFKNLFLICQFFLCSGCWPSRPRYLAAMTYVRAKIKVLIVTGNWFGTVLFSSDPATRGWSVSGVTLVRAITEYFN